MPNVEAARLYPGSCLFEGTNLSEGRGTANPFQQCSAPWLDHLSVVGQFNSLELPSIRARAVEFSPSTGVYAGESCSGIMLHVTDRFAVRPVRVGLHLLTCIALQHPRELTWQPYPSAANAPGHAHFDRLVGRIDIRSCVQEPSRINAGLITQWTVCEHWPEAARPFVLYASG